MNFDAETEALLQHYICMAGMSSAWKRYAWDRVNEMAATYPKWFGDFPQRLAEAMQEASDEAGCQGRPEPGGNRAGAA